MDQQTEQAKKLLTEDNDSQPVDIKHWLLVDFNMSVISLLAACKSKPMADQDFLYIYS